jgi:putative transposase
VGEEIVSGRWRDGQLTPAKMAAPLAIVWSRPLPEGAVARIHARIHARIADRRRDHLHKRSTRLVRENQAVVIEDLDGVRPTRR